MTYEYRPRNQGVPVWLIVVASIFVAIFLVIAVGSSQSGPNSRPAGNSTREPSGASRDPGTATGAYGIAKMFVADKLKSPGSAEFPWSPGLCIRQGDAWSVTAYVDSHNSYGALVRTQWTVVVRHKGDGKWGLVSLEMGE